MGLRNEQCEKVCRIIDDVLANRPTERDSLIVAVQKAFKSLERLESSSLNCSEFPNNWIPCSERPPEKDGFYYVTEQNYGCYLDADVKQRVAHTSHFKDGNFIDRFYKENYSNIVAYIKLPEPWKGE